MFINFMRSIPYLSVFSFQFSLYLNFGVMPMNISKLIPGIGRESTERYSSLKRLFIVPLTDSVTFLSGILFSIERLFIKYGGSVPERDMSLLDIVYRVL